MLYALPGTAGAPVQHKARYDNFIGGKFVGGCDIVTEMFERGELQPIVKAAAQG